MPITGIDLIREPSWSDEESHRLWSPRLRTASALWSLLERASVIAKMRPGAMLFLKPSELVAMSQSAERVGLCATPLDIAAGDTMRVVVHHPSKLSDWHTAWKDQNSQMVGALLGFPACCTSFFDEVWHKEKLTDTIPKMENHGGPVNILLRAIGIRLVPHLPCSSTCTASIELMKSFKDLARELGNAWQLRFLEMILDWPIVYTAFNGVAVIETPVLRFMMATDSVPIKLTIKREGRFISVPEHWEDCGFSSPDIMKKCHDIIVQVVRANLAKYEWNRVVDLGCGDGTLLSALRQAGCSLPMLGIDANAGRVHRGLERRSDIELKVGHVKDFEPKEDDLCLIMPERKPKAIPKACVVYAYADRLRKSTPESLVAMCKKAEIAPPNPKEVIFDDNVACGISVR